MSSETLSQTQTQTPKPLSIPADPLDILLPLPKQTTDTNTITILHELVDEILSTNETYSVTFSPVLCPVEKDEGGGKNQLFTVKPYWWQTEDGKWEWRDGQRNPECAKPQGQEQLQALAKEVHTLALGLLYITDFERRQECIGKIQTLLKTFFVDPETRMEPQVRFSQCHPGEDPIRGNDAFVIAIRFLILVDQAIILAGSCIDSRLVMQVKSWIHEQAEWMLTSEQGLKAKSSRKPLWYYVILSCHLRLSSDEESITQAKIAFGEWMNVYPTAEKAFENELKHDNRRHRCLFTLEPIFLLASLTVSRNQESNQIPNDEIKDYLHNLIDFLKTKVEKGPIEDPLENDIRFKAKLEWFENILKNWNNSLTDLDIQVKRQGPNGEGWQNGWNKRMRILWGFI
ncbi:uncharacterized protein L201_007979 [Kwoniella dendrophila CBS 6074]|uniref:Alginate lyase domain-containing protein n=1 Tax=Kwoniella dendrophila CBS 6074 TaxID=1295534 RepID=A0AAX4K843_9TREE